mmetsp:Transcript_120485/g.384691  ORF Transcript_120485/g.384691 Transcript_120485/m.384691 type:complete len:293 (-) Transcript_120485:257-1135(-)
MDGCSCALRRDAVLLLLRLRIHLAVAAHRDPKSDASDRAATRVHDHASGQAPSCDDAHRYVHHHHVGRSHGLRGWHSAIALDAWSRFCGAEHGARGVGPAAAAPAADHGVQGHSLGCLHDHQQFLWLDPDTAVGLCHSSVRRDPDANKQGKLAGPPRAHPPGPQRMRRHRHLLPRLHVPAGHLGDLVLRHAERLQGGGGVGGRMLLRGPHLVRILRFRPLPELGRQLLVWLSADVEFSPGPSCRGTEEAVSQHDRADPQRDLGVRFSGTTRRWNHSDMARVFATMQSFDTRA